MANTITHSMRLCARAYVQIVIIRRRRNRLLLELQSLHVVDKVWHDLPDVLLSPDPMLRDLWVDRMLSKSGALEKLAEDGIELLEMEGSW